jgi:hypothetical protein
VYMMYNVRSLIHRFLLVLFVNFYIFLFDEIVNVVIFLLPTSVSVTFTLKCCSLQLNSIKVSRSRVHWQKELRTFDLCPFKKCDPNHNISYLFLITTQNTSFLYHIILYPLFRLDFPEQLVLSLLFKFDVPSDYVFKSFTSILI